MFGKEVKGILLNEFNKVRIRDAKLYSAPLFLEDFAGVGISGDTQGQIFRMFLKNLLVFRNNGLPDVIEAMFTTNGWILVMKGNMTHLGVNNQPGPPKDILSYSL